jgi:hypothetical protein
MLGFASSVLDCELHRTKATAKSTKRAGLTLRMLWLAMTCDLLSTCILKWEVTTRLCLLLLVLIVAIHAGGTQIAMIMGVVAAHVQ